MHDLWKSGTDVDTGVGIADMLMLKLKLMLMLKLMLTLRLRPAKGVVSKSVSRKNTAHVLLHNPFVGEHPTNGLNLELNSISSSQQ